MGILGISANSLILLVSAGGEEIRSARTISRFKLVPTGVQVINDKVAPEVGFNTSVWDGKTTMLSRIL